MKSKIIIFIFCLALVVEYSESHIGINRPNMSFLKRPTGPYRVGFEDFHWINHDACPDFNFNSKNQDDFSSENTKYCHELVVRIYYPTKAPFLQGSPYYSPFISSQQDMLKQVPGIQINHLKQLTSLKSFSLKKAPIINEKQYPVLLFSPGFGCATEMYENNITELVSHGYIVVGISTPFINLTALPNGHVVKPADLQSMENSDKAISDQFVPLQSQDLIYAYNKLHELHPSNGLFASMDLKHVGLFGHSIGAWTVAMVAHANQTSFKAIAPLDIGPDKAGLPLKELKNFTIPVMYQINSIRKLSSPYLPVTYQLAPNGYLVGISPNKRNDRYSHHMNFTDWSTLQYLPAYTMFFNHLKTQHIAKGFDLKVMFHSLTNKEIATFVKMTYVLYKQENTWVFAVYFIDPQHHQISVPVNFFNITLVDGLAKALSALPSHPEKLTEAEIEPIRKIVSSLNNAMASVLGTGNGWEITGAINTYLVNFFDAYLKNKKSLLFKKCTPLYKNTYIKCGPGQA
ncbi:MAG: hypothetical protein H0U57_04655 [Tatlockia sp.]|nr:hypothetical protein [Tatlockia sp.]